MRLEKGSIIGQYQVLDKLGEGGMGEVYRAYDSNLRRDVALKVIRAEYTNNPELLAAFKAEALTASKLNHQNILTIYDFKPIHGLLLMVMEYVDGRTLRQCISEKALDLRDALGIAIQVAEALKEAHEAGVVHRDVKPENIMLRKGHVKILDFGIAKLIPKPQDGDGPPTVLMPRDDAPATVTQREDSIARTKENPGSPSYMSPEQWKGYRVDAKTDIWSLGVVLYEMVTGRRPFMVMGEKTLKNVIIEDDPEPLRYPVPAVSAALQSIIDKALRKDLRERYQSVEEMLRDLQKLKWRIDNPEIVIPVPSPVPPSPAPVGAVEFIKSKKIVLGATILVVLAVAVAAIFWPRPGPASHQGATPQETTNQTWRPKSHLTSTDNVTRAATSPDGNFFVYGTSDAAGNQSLWLGTVNGTERRPIALPAQVQYDALTFSRDGRSIYYVEYGKNSSKGTLYRSSFQGGPRISIMQNVPESFTFTLSPDAARLAFVRYLPAEQKSELVVADASNGREQAVLNTRPEPLRYVGGPPLHFLGGPAWSPDGNVIVWAVRNPETGEMSLVSVRVVDGKEVASTAYKWRFVRQISWLSDSSLLVLSALKEYGPYQIWKISYPGGVSEPIITDLNNYESLSLMSNQAAMIAVQAELITNVYVAEAGAEDKPSKIVPDNGSHNDYWGFAWTGEGKILYETTKGEGREQDLWVMDSNGANPRQLTSGAGANFDPTVTPDGRHVVFASDRAGHINIWRIDADGANPRQLTQGMRDFAPQISPDGKWVAYTSEVGGGLSIWKVSIDGGRPVQLTQKLSRWPAWSPDGGRIACFYEDNDSMKLAVISSEGGQALNLLDLPPTVNKWAEIRWRPGGQALTYIDTRDGVSNIRSKPLNGGPDQPLTRFGQLEILRYEWSPDGRRLVLSRGTRRRNVILMAEE